MVDFLKYLLFFLMAPFMTVLVLFMLHAYGEDTNGEGWYQELWDGNIFEWALAIILWPVFMILKNLVKVLYPFWEELTG